MLCGHERRPGNAAAWRCHTYRGARARIETAPYRPVQIGSNPGKIAVASGNQRRRIIAAPVTTVGGPRGGGLRADPLTVCFDTYKDTQV